MKTKVCENCSMEFEIKPHTDIERLKCCSSECVQELWRKNNPEKLAEAYQRRKAGGRRKDILRKFGITPDEYDAMLERQGGVCAVCKDPPTYKRLAVDHDHEAGKIRQLLCERCNLVLGKVDDDIELLNAMASYLQEHQ
jgi:hypothetical protein